MTTTAAHINESLVARIADGDENALRHLYEEFYPSLLFFAKKLISHHAQAEDYVLMAFTGYWERRSQFQSLPAVSAFLYKSVKNACLNYLEQQAVHARHNNRIALSAEQREAHADSRMILAEMIHEIHNEIEELNPIYREVIQLLYLQEKSIQEASDILQITPENVRKRKERAMQMLRNRIVKDNLERLLLFYIILGTLTDN